MTSVDRGEETGRETALFRLKKALCRKLQSRRLTSQTKLEYTILKNEIIFR